jgi:hypothetical protein
MAEASAFSRGLCAPPPPPPLAPAAIDIIIMAEVAPRGLPEEPLGLPTTKAPFAAPY